MTWTEEEIQEMARHDEQVRQTIEGLERAKADLEDQLNVARREIGNLSRDLQVARRERTTVEAARDSAQERERHALAEREQAWANVEAARQQRIEDQKAQAKAEREAQELGEENDSLRDQIAQLQRELADARRAGESYRRQVEALTSAGVRDWEGYGRAMEMLNRM